MAHPFSLHRQEVELRTLIGDLVDGGLDGLEVHYSNHDPDETALYLKLATEFDLAVTGGSDFHGASKPDIELGHGRERNLDLGYDLVEGLKARLS